MVREKKRRPLRTALTVILIIVLLIAAAAPFFIAYSVMAGGKRSTLDEKMEEQSKIYDTSFYYDLDKTDYTVEGYEGYVLHVEFLKNPEETDRYVIITHGYSSNRIGTLRYVPMYLDLGFNCIIYDLRGHGENERTITTYGTLEGEDLVRLIADTRERYDVQVLGLQGESLGAATTVSALKAEPDVDFAVADCGFSDIEGVLRGGCHLMHVPEFLVDAADFGAKVLYGYSLKQMRPIDALDNNTVPILFMHGEEDYFIPPENSARMYERTAGVKEFHEIPGAGHAQSMFTEPEMYKDIVRSFLEGIGVGGR
ncbi:MAG: alpha/beta hydrolase [Oscillospiraceae bacterium]|nr:alpha/beta hydrolase [Oscillospiraceae bacterium]